MGGVVSGYSIDGKCILEALKFLLISRQKVGSLIKISGRVICIVYIYNMAKAKRVMYMLVLMFMHIFDEFMYAIAT